MVSKRVGGRVGRDGTWITSARRYQSKLEQRPRVAFALASFRRFNKIEGKHLALVIALNPPRSPPRSRQRDGQIARCER
jgi:hypothetical protein